MTVFDGSRSASFFGKSGHNYSKLLLPVLQRSTGGLLDLVEFAFLADTATASQKLFAFMVVILSLVGHGRFRDLVRDILRDNLLLPDSESIKAEGAEEQEAKMPWELFWSQLTHTLSRAGWAPTTETVQQVKTYLQQIMESETWHTQAWLLFFALPSAFTRHVSLLSASFEPELKPWTCNYGIIAANAQLELVVSNFAGQFALHFPTQEASNGWAVFEQARSRAPPVTSTGTAAKKSLKAHGFMAGDLVEFQVYLHQGDILPSP